MIALKWAGLDPNAINTILITHFHGDHFGGIPYFVLDAQFFSKRDHPLTILGPAGLEDWFVRVMETAFPGSSRTKPKFPLTLQELTPGTTSLVDDLSITTARARHGPQDGPFHAYRIHADGQCLAYTGDTEWTDTLIEIGRHADLLIAEAYHFDKHVPLHLDFATLQKKLPDIAPKRLILTHMSADMLARLDDVPCECAYDGMRVTL